MRDTGIELKELLCSYPIIQKNLEDADNSCTDPNRLEQEGPFKNCNIKKRELRKWNDFITIYLTNLMIFIFLLKDEQTHYLNVIQ